MKKQLTFCVTLLTILCTSTHAQLPSYLPAEGLVAWYPFNGNANDESGNGNHGVVNGATLTSDRNDSGDAAYSFSDQSIQYIEVANSTSLNNIQSLTISLWCNLLSHTDYNHYVNKSDQNSVTQSGNYQFVLANNETGVYLYYNNWPNVFQTNYLPELNQWTHLVITYEYGNLNTCNFYANSNLLDSFTTTGPLPYTLEDIHIGGYSIYNYNTTNGKLDDIAIYNRALTEQEIQNLYTGNNSTTDTGNGSAPLPQGIPYQAAARDGNGQPVVNSPVTVRFSLHEGAADGAASYIESHSLNTNSIGLFNTVFGNGTPEQSAFDSINWAATTKFLQVEVDLGNGYVDLGTTQLLSVPYAFRTAQAANIKNAALPVYSDNAEALAGGLVAGEMYRTPAGVLMIVY